LVLHRDASVGDFYHGQIFEGVRQAAHAHAVDLMLLRYGEDGQQRGCTGYLFVNPLPKELGLFVASSRRRHPVLVVGARADADGVPSIDVDNVDLARQAVRHMSGLGHRRIAYVGGNDTVSNSRDRWRGFRDACQELDVSVSDRHVIRSPGWRLEDAERGTLTTSFRRAGRPTAVFAAGYYFALDVYAAAAAAGLRIPSDLSVVGVDDPPSAAHLSPPLTTLRQPLVQLGHEALTALLSSMSAHEIASRQLTGELIVRGSSIAAAAPAA
jgi:LacI family transcriptional regulator